LSPLRWSPDGRSILATGVDFKGRLGFFRIETQSGSTSFVAPAVSEDIGCPVWSPDGKAIYLIRMRQGKTEYSYSLVVHDLETGQQKELYRGLVYALALSPDGAKLAFVSPEVIMVMPSGGGEPKALLRWKEPERFDWRSNLVWSPDGRHLLFSTTTGGREPFELWEISAGRGQPRKLGLSGDSLRDLSVHPDGRRIAFTSGSPAQSEVWAMEKFLSALKAAQ